MGKIGERAIVAGAGIGGLLMARVLADHYEQVILLERDTFPPPGDNRRGIPQGRHTHALLTRGREVLDQLFPGLTGELIDRGAVPYDQLAEMRRFIGGGYYARGWSGLTSLMVSRPLLESHIRSRLLELRGVRAVERCDVLGLMATEDCARITGVRLIRREPGSAEEVCEADLTVDATGRGSRTPGWLHRLGYTAPEEERVEIGVGYATRHFVRAPGQLGGDLGVLVTPTRERRRVGIVVAQEGMRWSVTLIGYQGDAPPTDDTGFLEFARGLAAPDIYELVRCAEPLGDAVGARIPSNLRRRYEGMARFPEGLIVMGDALCSFNPAYGQGMTVAALEALALRDSLRRGGEGLAPRYFKAATAAVDSIWRITVRADRRVIRPEERRPATARLLDWYLTRLHVAARRDPVPAIAFVRVAGLLDRPSDLLRPRMAARVLWSHLHRARHARRPRSTDVERADSNSDPASTRSGTLIPFTPNS